MTKRSLFLVPIFTLAPLLLWGTGCQPGPALSESDAGPVPGDAAGPDVTRPDAMTPMRPDECSTSPGADADLDGFPNGVDCNDCSAQINPGAFDVAGNGIDENCDGSDDGARADLSSVNQTEGRCRRTPRRRGARQRGNSY